MASPTKIRRKYLALANLALVSLPILTLLALNAVLKLTWKPPVYTATITKVTYSPVNPGEGVPNQLPASYTLVSIKGEKYVIFAPQSPSYSKSPDMSCVDMPLQLLTGDEVEFSLPLSDLVRSLSMNNTLPFDSCYYPGESDPKYFINKL